MMQTPRQRLGMLQGLKPKDVAQAISFQATAGTLGDMVDVLSVDVFTKLFQECSRAIIHAAVSS